MAFLRYFNYKRQALHKSKTIVTNKKGMPYIFVKYILHNENIGVKCLNMLSLNLKYTDESA